jgi:hypothetical protein
MKTSKIAFKIKQVFILVTPSVQLVQYVNETN